MEDLAGGLVIWDGRGSGRGAGRNGFKSVGPREVLAMNSVERV